jgi:hypothetical protein
LDALLVWLRKHVRNKAELEAKWAEERKRREEERLRREADPVWQEQQREAARKKKQAEQEAAARRAEQQRIAAEQEAARRGAAAEQAAAQELAEQIVKQAVWEVKAVQLAAKLQSQAASDTNGSSGSESTGGGAVQQQTAPTSNPQRSTPEAHQACFALATCRVCHQQLAFCSAKDCIELLYKQCGCDDEPTVHSELDR